METETISSCVYFPSSFIFDPSTRRRSSGSAKSLQPALVCCVPQNPPTFHLDIHAYLLDKTYSHANVTRIRSGSAHRFLAQRFGAGVC